MFCFAKINSSVNLIVLTYEIHNSFRNVWSRHLKWIIMDLNILQLTLIFVFSYSYFHVKYECRSCKSIEILDGEKFKPIIQ